MAQFRILHVASFRGNIGDSANHHGTRALLAANLGVEICFTDLEIRKFYQSYDGPDKRSFDDNFASIANQHDLVLIGGGGFFELWLENSVTGTTIDISPEVLDRIHKPTVFYGLGCDTFKGLPSGNKEKFKALLDHLFGSSNYLVSVRNDGSKDTIRSLFGSEYASKIFTVPDGGFFTEVTSHEHPEMPVGGRVLAINLATDMLPLRFPSSPDVVRPSYEGFLDGFSHLLNDLLDQRHDLHIVLIPHIYSDLQGTGDLLHRLGDQFRRERITVAPYLTGEAGQDYIFDLYRRCDLVMGMRFHANVCPIGFGVPTVGLNTHPKIAGLYQEIGLAERSVSINQNGFEENLSDLVNETLQDPNLIKQKLAPLRGRLFQEVRLFHGEIQKRFVA